VNRAELGPLELFGVPAPTMFTIVSGVGTLFWVVAYVLVIRKGFQDRSFAMPIAALCGNIACEAIFSFLYPAEGLLRLSNYAWFALDLVILFQILKFAPLEFPERRPAAIRVQVVFGILVATWCEIAFIREFHDYGGAYVIYGQNLLMSAVFIAMVQQRRSARGQSMGIAISKMVGTGLFSVTLFLFSRDDFARGQLLVFLYVACFVLDLMYCLILRRYVVAARQERESGKAQESDKVLAS
jgi:hypothetical protein